MSTVAVILRLDTAQSITTGTFTTVTNWGDPIFQDVTVWSASTPSRITVPAGFNYALITANIQWGPTIGGDVFTRIFKNGDTGLDGTSCSTGDSIGFDSLIVHELAAVTENDYFEVQVWQNSGTTRQLAVASWFAIEFLQLAL
jgi:hypothetical protein